MKILFIIIIVPSDIILCNMVVLPQMRALPDSFFHVTLPKLSFFFKYFFHWNILNIFLFDNISSGKQELCLILFQFMGLFPSYSSFELEPNSVHSGHLYGHCWWEVKYTTHIVPSFQKRGNDHQDKKCLIMICMRGASW